jgi:uncharacterized protein YndB with AHSA1/START domain
MSTQHGYLVLADISGYTAYLVGSELDHAHEILSDLLETIVAKFETLLTISKLEGDAVFGYVAEQKLPRGETLLELIETTYVAFRDKANNMHRQTTCTCNACRGIPKLDLKFFVHHGDYIQQKVSTITELVGSDVNLVHRLMKNHLSETTGWKAYVMFSAASLQHIGSRPEGLHEQTETYEHLGDVPTLSFDLHSRYQQLVDARRVFLTPEEAYVTRIYNYTAPLVTVWEWFNDPFKRGQWMHSTIQPVLKIGGRSDVVGARNHCLHGKNEVVVEDVLDFRPFEYYTVSHTLKGTPATLLMTFRFTPAESGGTRVQIMFKGVLKTGPAFLNRVVMWLALQSVNKWMLEKIDELIAKAA